MVAAPTSNENPHSRFYYSDRGHDCNRPYLLHEQSITEDNPYHYYNHKSSNVLWEVILYKQTNNIEKFIANIYRSQVWVCLCFH
jgi:hypothetical protein